MLTKQDLNDTVHYLDVATNLPPSQDGVYIFYAGMLLQDLDLFFRLEIKMAKLLNIHRLWCILYFLFVLIVQANIVHSFVPLKLCMQGLFPLKG